MNYDDIRVEDEVNAVIVAVEQGTIRLATEKESLRIRFAALPYKPTKKLSLPLADRSRVIEQRTG